MATPKEIDLATRARDALLRTLQVAHITPQQDPDAHAAMNEITAWLINPDIDQAGAKPVFGYAATIGGVLTHCMVDERRRVWRLDTTTKQYVLL